MGTVNSDRIKCKYKIDSLKDSDISEYELKSEKASYKNHSSNTQSETTENSKIALNEIKISYKFEWKEGGNNVKIAASFLNDWKDNIDMEKNPSTGFFEIILKVPRGIHQFKFIVDDKWTCSPKYDTINNKNNTNNIIDLTNSVPENSNNIIDDKKNLKKKKKLKDCLNYSCNFPQESDINAEPPAVPINYIRSFNLNKQTKQNFLDSSYGKYHFDISRNQIENDTFKTLMTLTHDKTAHICYNIEANNNDINNKYISTIITQRNKHKFLTIIYFSPKK
jgi:hypothetical protein